MFYSWVYDCTEVQKEFCAGEMFAKQNRDFWKEIKVWFMCWKSLKFIELSNEIKFIEVVIFYYLHCFLCISVQWDFWQYFPQYFTALHFEHCSMPTFGHPEFEHGGNFAWYFAPASLISAWLVLLEMSSSNVCMYPSVLRYSSWDNSCPLLRDCARGFLIHEFNIATRESSCSIPKCPLSSCILRWSYVSEQMGLHQNPCILIFRNRTFWKASSGFG